LSDEVLYDALFENSVRFVKEKLSSDIIYAKEYSVLRKCIEEFKG